LKTATVLEPMKLELNSKIDLFRAGLLGKNGTERQIPREQCNEFWIDKHFSLIH
jgi:hypothetical protein